MIIQYIHQKKKNTNIVAAPAWEHWSRKQLVTSFFILDLKFFKIWIGMNFERDKLKSTLFYDVFIEFIICNFCCWRILQNVWQKVWGTQMLFHECLFSGKQNCEHWKIKGLCQKWFKTTILASAFDGNGSI